VKQTPTDTYANVYNPGFSAAAKAAVSELAKVLAGQQAPDAAVDAMRAAAQKAVEATK
jgi:alpha-1,4-digalacturonate transport system substrate-binding protein